MKVQLQLNCAAQLGEGIRWHSADEFWPRDGFFFVDIHGCTLHFLTQDGVHHQTWQAPERLAWMLASQHGEHAILGLQSGVARLRLQDGLQLDWLLRLFEGQPQMRLNDAKADHTGAIWAGAMNNDDESEPVGYLMRITAQDGAHVCDSGYQVPNGPALSPDGKQMLHTDSAQRRIYAFDMEHGQITGKRLWREFNDQEGYPDGMAFDAEGCLWVAQWGLGSVSRFSPTGQWMGRAHLPVTQPTCIAFGGDGLDRLFVTTARVGLDPAALRNQPLAGGVFEILGHGTRGLAPLPAGL